MTKGYNISNKSDASLSMNVGEQQIFLTTETKNVIETIKPTDDKFRQRSQRLLTKLRKITIRSISSNQEEEHVSQEKQNKPSFMSTMTSTPSMNARSISESRVDLGSTSNEEPKLKGILKTSTSFPFDGSCVSSVHTVSNPPSTMKNVRFNNKIQKKKYKLDEPVSSIKKLSSRQQKKLSKLQQRNSLTSQSNNLTYSPPMKSMNATKEKSINSPHAQDLISWESSEGESSDDDD